ncbi:hypothetical protein CcaverHIS002_0111040 [Cutaneotrichosporon cavernicola]|uniref:DNA repair protein RAD16 n=1 Tax=Cutaneotrichosporon cavernicola TaxID=279322 RepID=A0AA48HZK0_9TREE|nr:uncharacterized protein CcaverHIS019_0110940 [Cutaneotrichosporon cavernicola]BEI80575.1 hypothetical protein CcaverHIS002_0111040 [Cutaneotrichosporon cavernicola]BEI88376.1 hypothetical protein CcaverHIS019_0110940 [Cutaneotrichosporon cavernicola]BEI96149.1 hypothetical protein CcaverHIS631_0110980 [Cutaneotrichosporon cavernicola]
MSTLRRSARSRGLVTPATNDSVSPEVKAEQGLPTPESIDMDDSPSRTRKRDPSPVRPAKRQMLEAIVMPGRRSKLSTEKTTSADNLTLGTPIKTEVKSELKGEMDGDTTESDPDRPTKNDSSDEEMPLAARRKPRAVATRPGALKHASNRKVISISSSSEDEGMDYALNSDDEAKQLQRAIAASQAENGRTKRATTSRSRSTSSASTAKSTPKRAGNSVTPHRSAIARAAQLRMRASRGQSSTSGSTLPTPLDSSASPEYIPADDDEFEGSASDSALTALSGDESDEALSEEETKKPPKKKLRKTRARRLDGRTVADELPPQWKYKSVAERDDELDRIKEEKALIKDKEGTMSLRLGRKLTQGEKNGIRLGLHHPELVDAWGDLEANIEPVKPVPMEADPSLKLTLLPFQKESLYWMKKQEEGVWRGGMLADEMGMGKTIQTIALLLSEPRHKPSLVVAPVVALMQWKNEIETHAEGFKVCLWHGAGRMKADDLKKYDVVLVSYGTLETSFRRQQNGFKRGNLIVKEKSPMHTFEWYRVVLDEAHNIKERSTNAAKAAFALQAKYRWCLSGTPLQNRVGELYSLVRFLGADPFSFYFCKKCDCKSLHWAFKDRRHCNDCGHKPMDHVSLWNSEILTPIARYGIEEGGPGKVAFKKLKILLDRMMLRRTKLERADDLGLPPRTIVVRRDYFSPQEKELYMSLFTNAQRQFDTYVTSGTVLNNYSNIFSLITRMRQMACHPDLVLRSKTSTLGQASQEGTVCRICNDTGEDAIVSACHHVFDRECIRQYLEVQQLRGHSPECPVCHIEISIDLEQEAIEIDDSSRKARQGILSRLDLTNWRSSSKLEALVEELEKLRNEDCTVKSLVFSQFVSFLDLIAFRLQRAGFNICRLEGGMTPQQRDATIQHFMKNTSVTVFLISLKAGGVALNLTEASMVFMMDSWWNPSVEYQAMDRIHRLGQKRPVKVVKLVVEDSIEDQIVQLQAKKLAMTDAALSRDPDTALGKLTVDDLGFLFKL